MASAARLRAILAWCLAVGAEAGLLAGVLFGGLAPFLALIGHAMVAAVLVRLAWTGTSRDPDTDLAGLAIWTLTAGPFGPLLAAIAALGRRLGSASGVEARFADLLEGQPDDPATLRVSELCDALEDGRLGTGAPTGLMPLMEAIERGTQAEALAALRAVAVDFGADLAPVIRRAALSEDAAVRVLAATILADLKKRFSDRVSAARAAVDSDPDDAAARHALFEACMNYARSGLLSDDLAGEMRRMAFAYSDSLRAQSQPASTGEEGAGA